MRNVSHNEFLWYCYDMIRMNRLRVDEQTNVL